jgi:hypothetical protein
MMKALLHQFMTNSVKTANFQLKRLHFHKWCKVLLPLLVSKGFDLKCMQEHMHKAGKTVPHTASQTPGQEENRLLKNEYRSAHF